jgi:hypothetical protein
MKKDKRSENKGRPSEDRNKRIVVLLTEDEFTELKGKIGLASASSYVRDLILKDLEK